MNKKRNYQKLKEILFNTYGKKSNTSCNKEVYLKYK